MKQTKRSSFGRERVHGSLNFFQSFALCFRHKLGNKQNSEPTYGWEYEEDTFQNKQTNKQTNTKWLLIHFKHIEKLRIVGFLPAELQFKRKLKLYETIQEPTQLTNVTKLPANPFTFIGNIWTSTNPNQSESSHSAPIPSEYEASKFIPLTLSPMELLPCPTRKIPRTSL